MGLVFLCGCVSSEPAPDPAWQEVLPPPCDAPFDGFDRFTEETESRGIVVERDLPGGLHPGRPFMSSVVAIDGDADGDIDLFFPRRSDLPVALENDGSGGFALVDAPAAPRLGEAAYGAVFALADVDGDRLPDLVTAVESMLTFARNEGGLRFADPEPFHTFEGGDVAVISSLAVGDLDGDGQLDLVVPRNERVSAPQNPPVGLADLVFLRDGDTWQRAAELSPAAGAGMSLMAAVTDFDGDGDVLLPSDLGQIGLPPTALYRNDGAAGSWPDVAADVGADLAMSGMGVDAADLNGDGALDYCITDIGPIKCLLSGGSGFVESGLALGLGGPDLGSLKTWVGWSMDLADFDHDGHLDLAAVAAPPGGPESSEYAAQPDAVWRGTEDGFQLASEPFGFDPDVHRFGMATADLDGDGWLELITAGREEQPRVFWNRCGDGAWLSVDLRGLEDNRFAYGARVEVDDGARVRIREVQSLRSQGQGSGRLHFGLAQATAVDVVIRWPDGAITDLSDVPTRRRIVVTHPES